MKIVQINATCGAGSTGKICQAVSELLNDKGVENYILYSIGESAYPQGIKYSSSIVRNVQALFEKISGSYGFKCSISTKRLIDHLKKIKPDIVHIHNIHSHDVTLPTLFQFLKNNRIKVFWTFHDCWAFTGGCAHFDGAGCTHWLSGCGKCPIFKKHSFIFDRTDENYKDKKKAYGEGLDLTIITPSRWLGDLVRKSFLNKYPVKVINNGIDLNIFKTVSSDFRLKYKCEDRFILLGVAFGWGPMKGLDVFIRLAKELDSKYQVVLVGTNESVGQKLPQNIISIHRTSSQQELAEIYSAADLFVQLTREENFPTVNIEALACGTPVLTFNTGGSPEIIDDTCGMVVEKDDFSGLKESIKYIYDKKPFSRISCIKKASFYNKDHRFADYVTLYDDK